MCKRDVPAFVRVRVRPLKRDDSSRVLICAAGMWRSDWSVRVLANDNNTNQSITRVRRVFDGMLRLPHSSE